MTPEELQKLSQLNNTSNINTVSSVAANSPVQSISALVNPALGQQNSPNMNGRPANLQSPLYSGVLKDPSTGPNADYLNQVRLMQPADRINYNRYTSQEALNGNANPLLPNDYLKQYAGVSQPVPKYSGLSNASNSIQNNMQKLTSADTFTTVINPNGNASLFTLPGENAPKNGSIPVTSPGNLFPDKYKALNTNPSALDMYKQAGSIALDNISRFPDVLADIIAPGITQDELAKNRVIEMARIEAQRNADLSKQQTSDNSNYIPYNTLTENKNTVNRNVNNVGLNRNKILQNLSLANNPNAQVNTAAYNQLINQQLALNNANKMQNKEQIDSISNELANQQNQYANNMAQLSINPSFMAGIAGLGMAKRNQANIQQLTGIKGNLIAQQQQLLAKQQQDLIEKQLLGENAKQTDLANFRQQVLSQGVGALNQAELAKYNSQLQLQNRLAEINADPNRQAQQLNNNINNDIIKYMTAAQNPNTPKAEQDQYKMLLAQALQAKNVLNGKQNQQENKVKILDDGTVIGVNPFTLDIQEKMTPSAIITKINENNKVIAKGEIDAQERARLLAENESLRNQVK